MSFDRVARPYRLLELLTFGPLLRRTREHFLPHLLASRNALVLGDGDGRFLHALLRANPHLHALAVDASPRMLELLALRCRTFATRLATQQADLRHPPALTPHLQARATFDLVVTHFVLDCLSTAELHHLLFTLRPHLAPTALWVVSDFRIPPRGPLRPLANLLVRSLYLAFRLLTGLRVTRLPDYPSALRRADLTLVHHHLLLGGLLSAELWQIGGNAQYHTPHAVS